MRRVLFIIVILLVPFFAMAQASGGQIKRKQKSTTSTTSPKRKSSEAKPYSLKMTNSERETILNNLVKNMVFVEGGTFMMGATDEQGEDRSGWAYPVHPVTLSSFYICKFETTQEVWIAVMGDNPSEFKGNKLPVTNVTYRDVIVFIYKLNQITGKSFRLPTEAEWEYAARGGNKSKRYKYAGGNVLNAVAWYRDGTNKTHKVGLKVPNELGLFDMSGNVDEWCNDIYEKYGAGKKVNPKGGSSGSQRILRGGSIVSLGEEYCRTSNRNYCADWMGDYYDRGFRLACDNL